MQCIHCGHPVEAGAQFCSNCGYPVATPDGTTPPSPVAGAAAPTTDAPSAVSSGGFQPALLKTVGTSLAYGMAAALVVAILSAALLEAISPRISSLTDSLPYIIRQYVALKVSSIPFVSTVALLLAGGVSGTWTQAVLLDASYLGTLSTSGTFHSPFTLVGMALLVGTAAGAYRSARRLGTRFLHGGVVGSVMVGLAAGLCHILLAGLFSFKVNGIQVGAATGRTFLMAFLIAAVGSFMGYLLAQYAPDSPNVLVSCWQWSHRLRGWVRTVADASMVYGVVFTIIGLAGFVGYVLSTGNVWMLALIPLLFPFIPIILVVESSLGATLVASGTSGRSTLSILTAQNSGTRAILWVCFLVFLAATVLVRLRAAARNIYDPAHARWTDLWKAPIAAGLGWLVTTVLLARFSVDVTSSGTLSQLSSLSDSLLGTSTGSMLNASVSVSPSPWYVLIAASWMLLIEAMGLGFGRNLVVTWTPLWNAVRGGTVSPTPDDVQRHVRANDAIITLRGGRDGSEGDMTVTRELPDYASPFHRSSAQVGFPTTIPPLDRAQHRAAVAIAVLLAAATLLIVAMAFMGL